MLHQCLRLPEHCPHPGGGAASPRSSSTTHAAGSSYQRMPRPLPAVFGVIQRLQAHPLEDHGARAGEDARHRLQVEELEVLRHLPFASFSRAAVSCTVAAGSSPPSTALRNMSPP